MRSSKANRVPVFGAALLTRASLLAGAIACAIAVILPACSTVRSPAPVGPPPGYTSDVTPGDDGADLIGGAP